MKIITLCGSTKFKEDFERINKELTLQGNIVISVACFGHSGDTFTKEQKTLLDEIHKRKIDLADAIYVINKHRYIGNSTRSEIEYAIEHGKEVIYMIPPYKYKVLNIDRLEEEVIESQREMRCGEIYKIYGKSKIDGSEIPMSVLVKELIQE